MSDVSVLVLRTGGINCDEEVMHCWEIAGARPTLMHLNRLVERPALLDGYSIVTIPGGFSYGDDVSAGAVFAQRIRTELASSFQRLVERGGGLLGICNGFQVLVKAGLLPGRLARRDQVSITFNDSSKFEARWVRMEVCTTQCPFLTPGRYMELPVEHAEGRVVTADDQVSGMLAARGLIALRYVDAEGRVDQYPANPNGSTLGIAGLCDETGRVFGLMPHPDRFFEPTHHPLWTRREHDSPPDGLAVFQNAVSFWRKMSG